MKKLIAFTIAAAFVVAAFFSCTKTVSDGRVDELEKKVDSLSRNADSLLSALIEQVQSISFVPRYSDGSGRFVKFEETATFRFDISPAYVADSLVKKYNAGQKDLFALLATPLETKSNSIFDSLKITGASYDETDGLLVLTTTTEGYDDAFWNKGISRAARLSISDGLSDVKSPYFNVMVASKQAVSVFSLYAEKSKDMECVINAKAEYSDGKLVAFGMLEDDEEEIPLSPVTYHAKTITGAIDEGETKVTISFTNPYYFAESLVVEPDSDEEKMSYEYDANGYLKKWSIFESKYDYTREEGTPISLSNIKIENGNYSSFDFTTHPIGAKADTTYSVKIEYYEDSVAACYFFNPEVVTTFLCSGFAAWPGSTKLSGWGGAVTWSLLPFFENCSAWLPKTITLTCNADSKTSTLTPKYEVVNGQVVSINVAVEGDVMKRIHSGVKSFEYIFEYQYI